MSPIYVNSYIWLRGGPAPRVYETNRDTEAVVPEIEACTKYMLLLVEKFLIRGATQLYVKANHRRYEGIHMYDKRLSLELLSRSSRSSSSGGRVNMRILQVGNI